jgi:hypothetical protein
MRDHHDFGRSFDPSDLALAEPGVFDARPRPQELAFLVLGQVVEALRST